MINNSKYLFIYGTLLNADNHYGALLKNNSKYISPGSFNGLLYDLGEYPGALYIPALDRKVYGDIVELTDLSILTQLDEYEGYGETEEQPNLYIRQIVPVETGNEMIDCWAYIYNFPVDDSQLIPSGRYQ
ncbi:gamma-glutamylcyclotransferase family protein [Mucilaginibacter myungsuensis]|uniref:Gamma-glutamylcyclotransferase n=1 Tax=Mucilaginibacter myungsuensis TaxID=649104 RepID=A0A929KZM4_9SPHI|nr:gamma-glutamylcyclotransferase family protein [Mucilaginibacter myungsuensis]MBE9664644.1 gamma-glutamylcyclotransferase [Mucilaginibacter myungsuensis]MDN3601150.1 gamma-glutamylcyclotransferase family protein [Mucilaginibacter myungsuensis]